MVNQSILVIDDEKDILKLLQYNLEKEGYRVLLAKTGEEGFELAKTKKPDLIILDLMLPGIDGIEVCKLLKGSSATRHIPVMMLTAKSSEVDQVVGLELGASDYIAKPFSIKVLLVRVKNIFRTKLQSAGDEAVLKEGMIVLDRSRHRCLAGGKPVELTKLEFNILAFLMANPGKVFTRDQLLNGAWGQSVVVVDRTIDVHIRSIRKKLGKCRDSIETVRGTGYRFVEPE